MLTNAKLRDPSNGESCALLVGTERLGATLKAQSAMIPNSPIRLIQPGLCRSGFLYFIGRLRPCLAPPVADGKTNDIAPEN
jgi:hypothetical protein